MTSRLQVARRVAELITAGRRTEATSQAAAWLVSTGRGHQAGYLAQDVATVLAETGYSTVTVTSARPLQGAALMAATAYAQRVTGATAVEVATRVDPALIGGLRIDTPTARFDSSVRTQLTNLAKGA